MDVTYTAVDFKQMMRCNFISTGAIFTMSSKAPKSTAVTLRQLFSKAVKTFDFK